MTDNMTATKVVESWENYFASTKPTPALDKYMSDICDNIIEILITKGLINEA